MLRSCKEFRCNWRCNESHGAGEAGAWGDVIYYLGSGRDWLLRGGKEGSRRSWEQAIAVFQMRGEREKE